MVPSTVRHFARDDRLVAFLRVYQGAKQSLKAVTMSVRLTDANGGVVNERSESLAGERCAPSGSVDFSFSTPLNGLDAGEYRLDIEATALNSAPQRRQLKFAVRYAAE